MYNFCLSIDILYLMSLSFNSLYMVSFSSLNTFMITALKSLADKCNRWTTTETVLINCFSPSEWITFSCFFACLVIFC